MQLRRIDAWHWRSECGKYFVSRMLSCSNDRYTAWHDGKSLGTHDSFEQAQTDCAYHHELSLAGGASDD